MRQGTGNTGDLLLGSEEITPQALQPYIGVGVRRKNGDDVDIFPVSRNGGLME
jgi:hypothetical protein